MTRQQLQSNGSHNTTNDLLSRSLRLLEQSSITLLLNEICNSRYNKLSCNTESYNSHQFNDWYNDKVHILAWVFEEVLVRLIWIRTEEVTGSVLQTVTGPETLLFEDSVFQALCVSWYPNLVSPLESDLGKSKALPHSLEKLPKDSSLEVEEFKVLILNLWKTQDY
ncbi:hypothetical protein Tco_1331812 [Tanacetum coccineum]